MIKGYVSLEKIGDIGDKTFAELSPTSDLRLLSVLERTRPSKLSITWIPCPNGVHVIPREPERQYADNLVQWVLEKRAAVTEAAELAKGEKLTWKPALEFLLYYPSRVTPRPEKSLRGVSVYLPRAPFSGNLARISAVALMKAPNFEEASSDPLDLHVFPETQKDMVQTLWSKVKHLANRFAEKARTISDQPLRSYASQAVFTDTRLWVDPLRRTKEHELLSLTILEKGSRPINGLMGSSRQMNEEISKKLGDDILDKNQYYTLIQSLKIVDTRIRETVW